MKKKRALSLFALVAFLIVLSSCAALVATGSSEHKIRTSVKIRAAASGGYCALYDKLIADGMDGAAALNYISEGLGDKTLKLAVSEETAPENATVKFIGDFDCPFVYTEEKGGRGVDKVKLFRTVASEFDGGGSPEYSYIDLAPRVTLEALKVLTSERREFSTSYATSSPGRKNNIALAAEFLRGTLIEGGGEFSFNTAVGPRTAERGFQNANIIFNGEMVQGTGGGVCQVSSTLYNAFLLAGLEVTNASRHSRVIPYLPASRDAMVSSSQDLIARNPSVNPIYITTKADGSRLTIRVYGELLDCEYLLSSKAVRSIPAPAPLVRVEGTDIPEHIRTRLQSGSLEELQDIPYTERVIKEAALGLVSEAYRDKYVGGALIESTLISRDVYPAQRGEVVRLYNGDSIE